MDRRDFIRQSLAVAALPVGLGAQVLAAAAPPGPQAAVAAANVPLISVDRLHRLPRLPGQLQAVCFSPDGNQLAVACAVPEKLGITVDLFDLEGGKDYRRLGVFSNERSAFSVSWDPAGQRLALSTFGNDKTAAKPFETRVRILDVTSGQILTDGILLAERNPLDKKGVRTPVAWLDDNSLLATQEGSHSLYKIGLNDGNNLKLISVYQHPRPAPETTVYSLAPVSLGRGFAGAVYIQHTPPKLIQEKSPERIRAAVTAFEKGPREYKPLLVTCDPAGNTKLEELRPITTAGDALFHSVFVAARGYLVSYVAAQGTKSESWIAEFIRKDDGTTLARVPAKSEYAAAGFDICRRFMRCISPSANRVALFEIDGKQPDQDDEPLLRNSAEPFGRIVVGNLPSL
ncbi:MAG: WD40 repeat domain-containing protein [Planctomycetota bacterium]